MRVGRDRRKKVKTQLLTVDHSARGSMKTAASCVSVCESQEYQIHRQVERTLRRRHSNVLPSLLHEGRISNPCIGFVVRSGASSAYLRCSSASCAVVAAGGGGGFRARSDGNDRLGEFRLFALVAFRRRRVWLAFP